ncbi:hypothetical protein ACPOL_0111 [Acidisarcina polymorpha]|uniref:DUF1015 domain-containing protein n=2 Tax=Acidisarcina polymorpha TaxID=2211140 RepID=A0A2Z5FRZ7_9BACT|nr:DUF1015 domain-containing protein [Acidisarcina polymorpha]AXC09498.1 hypothetical protein ACPOL_0111 [Acidisarcina polymorpha]
MARIYPFRALRYNPSRVRIEDVVTQPYDKISPSMQQAYYQRSPYNLVRIILGLPELFDQPLAIDSRAAADVYSRSARDFAEWRAQGILYREKDPCIFAYSQRFAVASALTPDSRDAILERRGFIALGELSDYREGIVFRHEQTLAKPISDRLSLLRATRAHFGQIFMLYSDPAQTVDRLLFGNDAEASADLEVVDEFGVLHRISRISDPATINLLSAAMEDKKLIIADGHHRYETALEYSRERVPEPPSSTERNSHAMPQPPYPEAAVMMTFINIDSPGLVILPTHRVVFGLKDFSTVRFLERAETFFDIESLTATDPEGLLARLAPARASRTAFIVATAEGRYLFTLKTDAAVDALKSIPDRQRQLDIVRLHTLVLEKLLGITPEAIREQRNVHYHREPAEALEEIATGQADLAFLVNPVTLDQLREVAFAGDVMPQKSTDFYPKLLSGLAIYALD